MRCTSGIEHCECKLCLTMAAITTVPESPRETLAGWWRNTAENEINMVVDKAVEYGATDLYEIGREIYTRMGKKEGVDYTAKVATSAGIYFYLIGKLARWGTAVEECRMPHADTPLDVGVYARMMQRVLEVGEWPGV